MPECIVPAVKFGGGVGLGAVFHGLGPLVPGKGNFNATASNDILDYSALPNIVATVWGRPLSISA